MAGATKVRQFLIDANLVENGFTISQLKNRNVKLLGKETPDGSYLCGALSPSCSRGDADLCEGRGEEEPLSFMSGIRILC